MRRAPSRIVIALVASVTSASSAQVPAVTGYSLVVVKGPVSVHMGSPADEEGRQAASDSAAEPQHTVVIPRSFAISATEVTVAQFRQFLDATPAAKSGYRYDGDPERMAQVQARFSPDDDGPAIAVTWYEAAMYCNWLSAREGLPPAEWVYPAGTLRDGFTMPANYLQRRGYRLPTEPEWEFAARAGTATSRFFGDSEQALGEYAWFARHPPRSKDAPVDPTDPQRTNRVGALKPNPLGSSTSTATSGNGRRIASSVFRPRTSWRIARIPCSGCRTMTRAPVEAERSLTAPRLRGLPHAERSRACPRTAATTSGSGFARTVR
jgi:formylglycine-generating enzyme required for sulfatase activity